MKTRALAQTAQQHSHTHSDICLCVTVRSRLKNEQIRPIKGIVHPKTKTCRKCSHPQAIQNVDEFVASSEQIWINLALHHLLTWGSSAVNGCRQNQGPKKKITIIHICLCLSEKNPPLRHFNFKPLLRVKIWLLIHNIASSVRDNSG